MSYSGFTATADNGVIRVTTDNSTLANAQIDGETVVLTSASAKLRGNVMARRTQFRLVDNQSGPHTKTISYHDAAGNVAIATNECVLTDSSSVLVSHTDTAAPIALSFTEISKGSEIIYKGSGGSVYVYTSTSARLSDCIFDGIYFLETVGSPSVFSNVSFLNTRFGQLNWEGGLVTRYGINIPSTTGGYDSICGGGAANSTLIDWNPVAINPNLIVFANEYEVSSATQVYHYGWTASYKWVNIATSAAVEDVLVILRDDRASVGGALSERGRYTTNAVGRLAGTFDSRTGATGANIERPTAYVLRKQSRMTGGTAATGVTGFPSTQHNHAIDAVAASLEVRSYGYEKPNSTAFSIDAQIGKLAGDTTVSEYASYNLTQDTAVTLTYAAALALTTIATLDQLYDRVKAQWRLVDDFTYPSSSGSSLLIAVPIVVDGTALSVCSFSAGILTVKAGVLAIGTKFTKLVTTGTIAFVNGAAPSATLVYQSSVGTSVPVTAPNLLTGSRVQLYNVTSSTQMDNVIISTGGYAGRFTWSTDITIRLRAAYCVGASAQLVVEDTTVLTNTGASFLNSQVNDTIYNAAAINGSTVTEFAADYPNVQIDVTDPDGVTTVPRIYAWYVNNLTTASGVASFFGGMVADDAVNFVIKTAIVNLKLDNRNTAPCIIAGGRLYADTNATVIAALSNSIQMDPNRVYVAETGVSGLTAAESALLANITPIRNLIEADEVHTTTTVQKRLRGTATVLLTKTHSGTPLNTFQAIQ